MEKLIIKSKSISKNKNHTSINNINPNQRKSSHDFSEYFLSKNKNDSICYPLKPKEKIRSKFFQSKIKITLPKLEEAKIIFPGRGIVSSKLMDYNKSATNNKSKNSLCSMNFPKLTPNKSQVFERVEKVEQKRINKFY